MIFGLFNFKKSKNDFAKTNVKKLTKYIKENTPKDQMIVDFQVNDWGHAMYISNVIFQDKKNHIRIFEGHGFYGRLHNLRGKRHKLRIGDIALKKLENGKIGKYFLLEVNYENDPFDMFWYKAVGVGYYEPKKA